MPCKCVGICCHIWWGNERYARGLTKDWWQIYIKKSGPRLLAAWICPPLSGSMFSFHQRSHISPHYPQIILPLAIAGSIRSFEKFAVICQMNGTLELLAGFKMVMEGCVQNFEQGQQFTLCVWMHHSSLPKPSCVSLSRQAWCPRALAQEILLGDSGKEEQTCFVWTVQFLMFSTWSPKHY